MDGNRWPTIRLRKHWSFYRSKTGKLHIGPRHTAGGPVSLACGNDWYHVTDTGLREAEVPEVCWNCRKRWRLWQGEG